MDVYIDVDVVSFSSSSAWISPSHSRCLSSSVSLSSAMRSIDVMDDKYFYERESNSFLETLLEFHRSRGTPIPRFPVVAGKKVDLFKLYNTVTELGG